MTPERPVLTLRLAERSPSHEVLQPPLDERPAVDREGCGSRQDGRGVVPTQARHWWGPEGRHPHFRPPSTVLWPLLDVCVLILRCLVLGREALAHRAPPWIDPRSVLLGRTPRLWPAPGFSSCAPRPCGVV